MKAKNAKTPSRTMQAAQIKTYTQMWDEFVYKQQYIRIYYFDLI